MKFITSGVARLFELCVSKNRTKYYAAKVKAMAEKRASPKLFALSQALSEHAECFDGDEFNKAVHRDLRQAALERFDMFR